MKQIVLLSLLFIIVVSSCKQSKPTLVADENNTGLILPEGFGAIMVADSIGRGRHIVVDSTGIIYVSLETEKNGGGIVCLKDINGDGRADDIKYYAHVTGTGIRLFENYLYFGTDTSIIRFSLDEQGVPSTNFETLISGYTMESQHGAKNFTFDQKGKIYVNVGAPSNACQINDRNENSPGMDPCPILETYGGIWKYSAHQLNQVHKLQGTRYATGLRNAMAVYWNTEANQLFALSHGRDQLNPLFKNIYDSKQSANLPAEEMFAVNEGDDFGWPYCYFDPVKNKKILGPEYGGDGSITDRCDSIEYPIVAFPAHYAPNDLLFYTGNNFPTKYQHGAFIAFHGSWNRSPEPQGGYMIAFVPFSEGKPSGAWEVFADNFAGTKTLANPGDAEHRPCGIAVGPDGSMYVIDSRFGRVWRIFYRGEK